MCSVDLDPEYVDLVQEFYQAYLKARKGKRGTADETKFEINAIKNIIDLANCVEHRQYKPSRSIAFVIFSPVVREIFAAPFRDRVIHHFLFDNCYDWWDRRLICDSYSCRKNKGTLYGVRRLYEHMRVVSEDWTKDAYVIKMDIEGYFMSLAREKLYERIIWGLDCQFPNGGTRYETLKYLWNEVIFDDPIDGVEKRGPLDSWEKLPKRKSLFYQPLGKGIVIGNLTSQLLSNVYLDQLDRYVKFVLGYDHYGRYVDDFYIVVKKEELKQAMRDVEGIRNFLMSIGLTLHRHKMYVQPISHGVDFLGVVLYPRHIVPGKRFKKSFRKAAKMYYRAQNGDAVITSYLGSLTHIKGKKLACKVFTENGWVYRY